MPRPGRPLAAEYESEIEQTEMALERVKRKATADVVQSKADLGAKKAELDQQKKKLAKLQDQLTKTKIYSPVDGKRLALARYPLEIELTVFDTAGNSSAATREVED